MDKKEVRELRGDMSTSEFGEMFMVSARTVEGWEQGRGMRASIVARMERYRDEKHNKGVG